jgi:hypothetical protein
MKPDHCFRYQGIEFYAAPGVTNPSSFVTASAGTVIIDHCYFHISGSQTMTQSAMTVRGGSLALNGSYVRFALQSRVLLLICSL